MAHCCNTLCNLTLVVGEYKVHTSAVNVELLAKVFASHGCTLAVPSGESVAPGRGPAHNMLGLSTFPKGKVGGVAFLALSVKLACGVEHILEVASRKNAIVVGLVVFCNIEIYRAFAYVCKAIVDNLFHELNLLDNVTRCVGLDAGRKHVESLHRLVVAQCVVLHNFHGLELLETSLLCNLVLALVCIVLKMANVGDVTHVTHLVTEVSEVSEKHVKGDCGACVSQMGIAINCGAANVEAYIGSVQGHKLLFLTRQRIIYHQFVLHRKYVYQFIFLFISFCLLRALLDTKALDSLRVSPLPSQSSR